MIYLYIALIFIFFGCDSIINKKIYKTFDVIEGESSSTDQLDNSRWVGGPGFEEIAELISWKTNNDINIIGDPNAVRGDTIRFFADDVFPNTLRAFGKETRSQLNSLIEGLIYEPLLSFDAET